MSPTSAALPQRAPRAGSAIAAFFAGVLEKHLLGRTKRLIFVASFSARLKGEANLDEATLSKLNEVMLLCNSDSAMKMPVLLSKAIWQGQSITEICSDPVHTTTFNDERLRSIAVRVWDRMPQWLRYADAGVVQTDIVKLLGHRSVVLGH